VLIDTHAHINAPQFADDWAAVVSRAAEAGVGTILCVGYDLPTTERALALAETDPRIFASVGLHPNCVAEAAPGWQRTLERLVQHPRVVAVGETGLDYYREFTPRDLQLDALRWHLALAEEHGLPVILHNRDSDDDLTAAVLAWMERRDLGGAPGVLHSFCGSTAMMRRCVAAGFAVSFSGMVTFPNKSLAHVAEAAEAAPVEALLVETDSPYLAPVPFRGQRNEPAFVRAVAERVAALRSIPIEELEERTTENAQRVFPRLAGYGRG
jgi:TatD DNase family protein